MGRLYRKPFHYLLFSIVLAALATLLDMGYFAGGLHAQAPTPTLTPTANVTASPEVTTTPDSVSTPAEPAATAPASTSTPTDQSPAPTLSPQTVALPTPTPAALSPIATAPSASASTASGPLEGTIIANRSDESARFFVEGATYVVDAGDSQGLNLLRTSSVLNLFNCPASTAESTTGCFWDPYLVELDGFYEIYTAPGATAVATLLLREAGSPPTNQVWVQNRTENVETIVFRGEVQEIAPAAILEFPVPTGVPAILYVRSCLTLNGQSVCEWAPKTLDAGIFYAMVRLDTAGTQAGSLMSTIDLRAVVAGSVAESAEAPVASGPAIACRLLVPALNIRSGPGLQYDIVGKVRSEGADQTEVSVMGRSADNEWLTVDPAVVAGGWINNNSSFVTCAGNVSSLPIVEAPAPPAPVATAVPQVAVPQDTPLAPSTEAPVVDTAPDAPTTDAGEPPAEAATEATPEPSAEGSVVPPGQSLLLINNGFEHEMRFTIDQVYRPLEGPSEYDLQPGASISLVVYPGQVAFTASSPWGGLSQNAEIFAERDQSKTLWLRFERDASGSWVFKFD